MEPQIFFQTIEVLQIFTCSLSQNFQRFPELFLWKPESFIEASRTLSHLEESSTIRFMITQTIATQTDTLENHREFFQNHRHFEVNWLNFTFDVSKKFLRHPKAQFKILEQYSHLRESDARGFMILRCAETKRCRKS